MFFLGLTNLCSRRSHTSDIRCSNVACNIPEFNRTIRAPRCCKQAVIGDRRAPDIFQGMTVKLGATFSAPIPNHARCILRGCYDPFALKRCQLGIHALEKLALPNSRAMPKGCPRLLERRRVQNGLFQRFCASIICFCDQLVFYLPQPYGSIVRN